MPIRFKKYAFTKIPRGEFIITMFWRIRSYNYDDDDNAWFSVMMIKTVILFISVKNNLKTMFANAC